MPAADALQLQREALDLVASFPGGRRAIGPAQAEALLRIDARFEPVIGNLTAQYTANYQRSSSVETRLWHAVFDLVKAFIAAYEAAVKSGYGGRDEKQLEGGHAAGFCCGLRTTKDSTASSGCFVTGTGYPRNGAKSTSSTNSPARGAGSANRWRSRRIVSAPDARRRSRNTSRRCC